MVFDEHSREVYYEDKSVTGNSPDTAHHLHSLSNEHFVDFKLHWSHVIAENTRAAYPIEYIPNAKIPCVGPHPTNVILLACDAFGVLPPVSKLNLAQTMYHFISGYTALVHYRPRIYHLSLPVTEKLF